MAIIRQQKADFRPVTVRLDTQRELDAFISLLSFAKQASGVPPASDAELLITQLEADMAGGIRVGQ